ncbi:MAG: GerMN domain-containing protein [Bacilli bacterium]|nr:GerMN domain-containing protein [Bacilli bacterium]
MIKRLSTNKIIRMSSLLFILLLLYIFPSNKTYEVKTKQVSNNTNYHDIFLLDKNGYVSKTTIAVSSIEKEKLALDLLTSLTINSKNKNKIPEGFSSLIPKKTSIQKVRIDNETITVSFSPEIKVSKNKTKMVESIVYTLTSIDNIKKVYLMIDNKEDDYFSNNYDRSIGINHQYDINSIHDLSTVTLYYVSKNSSNEYYIPVTKMLNTKEDKIKVIIDELASKSSYESNLMSYLNYETKLTNYEIEDNDIKLYFTDSILSSKSDNKILEEVKYSISYSIKDSIEVSNIHFFVNDEEI